MFIVGVSYLFTMNLVLIVHFSHYANNDDKCNSSCKFRLFVEQNNGRPVPYARNIIMYSRNIHYITIIVRRPDQTVFYTTLFYSYIFTCGLVLGKDFMCLTFIPTKPKTFKYQHGFELHCPKQHLLNFKTYRFSRHHHTDN